MQTAPEIGFLAMEPRPDLRARIEDKLAHLEKLYGRMTACRVVARVPSGDPDFALNDAFKRARRQLQGEADRIRGET